MIFFFSLQKTFGMFPLHVLRGFFITHLHISLYLSVFTTFPQGNSFLLLFPCARRDVPIPCACFPPLGWELNAFKSLFSQVIPS